jgi:hypothetical protein
MYLWANIDIDISVSDLGVSDEKLVYAAESPQKRPARRSEKPTAIWWCSEIWGVFHRVNQSLSIMSSGYMASAKLYKFTHDQLSV